MKKAKKKTIIIISICILVIVAVVVVAVFLAGTQRNVETYSNNAQTVHFYEDGRFSAVLAHNVLKNGTFSITEENGSTTVQFNYQGRTEFGEIRNDRLHIPEEWDDAHNHGRILPKR